MSRTRAEPARLAHFLLNFASEMGIPRRCCLSHCSSRPLFICTKRIFQGDLDGWMLAVCCYFWILRPSILLTV